MHLPCDPGALSHSRPLLVQALIRLGPQGPIAQGEEKLPSGADEHPPCGDGDHERCDPQQHRHRVGRGTVRGEDQGEGDPQRSDEQSRPDRSVHREGEQREEPRRGGGNRNCPQHETGERNNERPTPPPPQRDAGQHSAGNVDDHLRTRQRLDTVAQGRAQEERPERGGDEASEGIDGSIPTGPRTGRVVQRQIPCCRQGRRPHELDPQPGRRGHYLRVGAGAWVRSPTKVDGTATKGGACWAP